MTYQSIRNRIASIVPNLSESQLDWATPLAVSAATGLGASAFNVVSPWDIDPVAASLASGGATYLMGRGRIASPIGEDLAGSVVAAPPKKPPPNPTRPTPNPRVAVDNNTEIHPLYKESNKVFEDAIANTNTVLGRAATEANVAPEGLIVPAPTINDYIAKSPLLDKDRAARYADPTHPDYQPDFVKMISQEGLDDDFRAKLAFPEDVLTETFRNTGVPSPVVTGATHLPILMGSFDGERYRGKLNSDVLVIRGSSLSGGEGKSDLVNRGVVPEGTYYPNIVTSNPQSLLRMAQGVTPTLQDPGYYIGKDQVLTPPPTSVARGQYINLTNSGRMAVPMTQKNLSEPMLYVDELSGGSSPYDINDFYGLRASKKRTTDKTTGNKYYRGVFD